MSTPRPVPAFLRPNLLSHLAPDAAPVHPFDSDETGTPCRVCGLTDAAQGQHHAADIIAAPERIPLPPAPSTVPPPPTPQSRRWLNELTNRLTNRTPRRRP